MTRDVLAQYLGKAPSGGGMDAYWIPGEGLRIRETEGENLLHETGITPEGARYLLQLLEAVFTPSPPPEEKS